MSDNHTNIEFVFNPWEFLLVRKNLHDMEGENYGLLFDCESDQEPYSIEECLRTLSEQFSLLAMQMEVQGLNHPNTALIHNCIARQYVKMHEYEKALFSLMTAKNIREQSLGEQHMDTAASYDFIAGIYYLLKDYADALSWLQKSLHIKEVLLGGDHDDTQTTRELIDRIHMQADDISENSKLHKANTKYS